MSSKIGITDFCGALRYMVKYTPKEWALECLRPNVFLCLKKGLSDLNTKNFLITEYSQKTDFHRFAKGSDIQFAYPIIAVYYTPISEKNYKVEVYALDKYIEDQENHLNCKNCTKRNLSEVIEDMKTVLISLLNALPNVNKHEVDDRETTYSYDLSDCGNVVSAINKVNYSRVATSYHCLHGMKAEFTLRYDCNIPSYVFGDAENCYK